MAFIDPKKLLNASDDKNRATAQPKMFLVPIKNTQYRDAVDLSQETDEQSLNDGDSKVVEDIRVITENVIKVEDILKKSIKINLKKIELNRKKRESEKRSKREERLERKERKKSRLPGVPIPGMSFLEKVKQFIGTVFTGFLILKLIKLLPKLEKFLDLIKPVISFVSDFASGMLDKLVSFIDFGYRAVDTVESKIEEIFGEQGEKKFKEFTSTFTKFMNLAIIAGMATMGGEDPLRDRRFDRPERKGFDKSGRRVRTRAQERYLRRYGDRKFTERFGNKNARRLDKLARQRIGIDGRVGRGGFSGLVQKGATRVAGKTAGKIAGKIPIVGPLIDFGIRYFIFKESLGKSAAAAVGAGVGQALGTWLGGVVGGLAGSVVPIVGNLLGAAGGAALGGLIGGVIGDQIGVSLYNTISGSEEPSSVSEVDIKTQSGGGQVGKQTSSVVKPVIQRRRGKKFTPEITRVGKNTGTGIIKKIYGTDDPYKPGPVKVLFSTARDLKRREKSIFSKLAGLGVDFVLGQQPSGKDATKIAESFLGLFYNLMNPSELAFTNISKYIQGLSSGGKVQGNSGVMSETSKRRLLQKMSDEIRTIINRDFNRQASKTFFDLAQTSASPNLTNAFVESSRGILQGAGDAISGFIDDIKGLFGITADKFIPLTGTAGESRGNIPLSIPYSPFASKRGSPTITSAFGNRWGKHHQGLDVGAAEGTPLYAYLPGKVIFSGVAGGYGNRVEWQDSAGNVHSFSHMKNRSPLNVGDPVKQGQLMGRVGNTGSSTAPHLHWEILTSSGYVDPVQWTKKTKLQRPKPSTPTSGSFIYGNSRYYKQGNSYYEETLDGKKKEKIDKRIYDMVKEEHSKTQKRGSGKTNIKPAQVIPLKKLKDKNFKLDIIGPLSQQTSYEKASQEVTVAVVTKTVEVPIYVNTRTGSITDSPGGVNSDEVINAGSIALA